MALTKNRKLRTSTPVWVAYPRRITRAQRLKKDLATDVLVVGAGISGALIAYSVVSCLVNKFSMMDTAFDVAGGFSPDEGLGVVVPVGEEADDGVFELRDTSSRPDAVADHTSARCDGRWPTTIRPAWPDAARSNGSRPWACAASR